MASKFTDETRARIIAAVGEGSSLPDAATAADVSFPTIRKWLKRGGKEEGTDFARFRADVAAAREKYLPEPLTDDEHRRIVSMVARRGSVQALKLYWEMILADRKPAEAETPEADPLDGIDELAERRAA